jgi:HK97 gp10 family phage protein
MSVRSFDSITDFLVHVTAATVAVKQAEHAALKNAALLIEREAKGEIGTYQPQVGPFPEWAPLAESTEASKKSKGYPAGAPLLASGQMRARISHEIDGLDAVIGSPDDIAVFHEFGTSKMPPRPIFGPAVYKNLEKLHFIIGTEVVAGIIEGKVASGGADYFIGSD